GLPMRGTWEMALDATREVGPALFFSLLIITLSFIPVFALEAQEGRLFKPLAYTKTFAMAASSLLAITLVPVAMGLFIRGKIWPEHRNPINRFLRRVYRPALDFVLAHRLPVLAGGAVVLAVTVIPWRRLGSEFMPPLQEGTLLFMPTMLPGVSIREAVRITQIQDSILKSFPEVKSVFGKVGRANTPTDPAPLSMVETVVELKPESEWRKGMSVERLVAEMDKAVRIPGVVNSWTMPIKGRIDMLSTGIRTPVGIKVFGRDLKTLDRIGRRLEEILPKVRGTRSVIAERLTGQPYIMIETDREAAARYGLTVGDIQDVVMTAIGGNPLTQTVEGLERYTVNVRYAPELRESPDELARVLVPTMMGVQIPLGQIARIWLQEGPPMIRTENALPTEWVFVDVEGRDIGSYVREAQEVVRRELELPEGTYLQWSGQYEYMQRAIRKLRLVVPLTLAIILLLLFFNFRNVTESLIVMLSLPFSLVGGVWFMWALGYNLSVAVGVGFIALAGVAAEIGVVMLVYLDEAYKRRTLHGDLLAREDLLAAVREGAGQRVRPVIMTVTAVIGGLLPIMWSAGTGASVMKRIAAPMVGGMLSATVLALLMIPAIYSLWREWQLRRVWAARREAAEPPVAISLPAEEEVTVRE
ncbi:MAG: efflux RND transporter permease subunit, partial [Gemmatimonadetes bacterium]|nr:efflux RND transporter permease subunit [Gemmatimonadota bacterium]